MEVLRFVETRLVEALTVAQQHLEGSKDGKCSASPAAASTAEILANIDRLQDQIRASTHLIASQTEDLRVTTEKAAERFKNSLQLQSGRGQVEDSDTETDEELEGSSTGNERGHTPSGDSEAAAREKQLYKTMKRFSYYAKQAAGLDGKAERSRVLQVVKHLKRTCSTAMTKLIKFLSDGEIPRAYIAEDFVQTIAMLPAVTSQLEMNVDKKWIATIMAGIERLLKVVSSHSGLPPALKDPQLQATKTALEEHVLYSTSFLNKMKLLTNAIKLKPESLQPNRIAEPLQRLATYFQKDINKYDPRRNAPRTEERWEIFTEVAETLAEWIRTAELASPSPMLPVKLANFERHVKTFSARYPKRIPDGLLNASAALANLATDTSSTKT